MNAHLMTLLAQQGQEPIPAAAYLLSYLSGDIAAQYCRLLEDVRQSRAAGLGHPDSHLQHISDDQDRRPAGLVAPSVPHSAGERHRGNHHHDGCCLQLRQGDRFCVWNDLLGIHLLPDPRIRQPPQYRPVARGA